jgi:hypothetical protein
MRRRQLALLLCLVVGVALWLTRSAWLPPLLAQLPPIQGSAALLGAPEVIVSVALLAACGVLVYLLWRSRYEGRVDQKEGALPLRSTTPQRIRRSLGRGGQVNWIDRGISRVGDLHSNRRLVITGRRKLGKTRELA